jgi:hypothetical protein
MNKRGFEFSFAWIFAVLVGAVILFLAIFATTRLIGIEGAVQNTELGREIGILLSPIETNLESVKIAKIDTPTDTRIFNECEEGGVFGRQNIRVGTRSSLNDEWSYPGEASTFFNKYLFSDAAIEGDEFVVMAKPFKLPFKVADLIFLWSSKEKYCFVRPPRDMEEEIEVLRRDSGFDIRLDLSDNLAGCGEEDRKVCFDFFGWGGDCDISVSTTAESVRKGGKILYYEQSIGGREDEDRLSLLYAAIFADPEIYECQVKRLMRRTSELSLLYLNKTEYLSSRGCSSNLEIELKSHATKASSVKNSLGLDLVFQSAGQIRSKNDKLVCKLF